MTSIIKIPLSKATEPILYFIFLCYFICITCFDKSTNQFWLCHKSFYFTCFFWFFAVLIQWSLRSLFCRICKQNVCFAFNAFIVNTSQRRRKKRKKTAVLLASTFIVFRAAYQIIAISPRQRRRRSGKKCPFHCSNWHSY